MEATTLSTIVVNVVFARSLNNFPSSSRALLVLFSIVLVLFFFLKKPFYPAPSESMTMSWAMMTRRNMQSG